MEKLFKKIKKESLSPDEKLKILSVLQDFVSENPAHIKSPFYGEWFVWRYRAVMAPVAVILIFVLTGGTVSLAKNSLPGDKLYSVKMLKESVESFTALDSGAKAQVEVSHAISRLEELEKIINSNKPLEKGSGKEISNNFETEVKDVVSNINELKSSGKIDDVKNASAIWSDFKKTVSEHEKTITELSNSTSTESETKQELDNVVTNVRSHIEKTEREDKENQTSKKKDDKEDDDD